MGPDPSESTSPETAPLAANLNALWARAIVDELARAGLEYVVISPGSRSAALVHEFAAHPAIHDLSIVDERAAAFFALGLARATLTPVALLCTTGTAAANYFPAICEAARDRIPLLVLTAARPADEHDCGQAQVMDQTRLYGRFVRAFSTLPEPGLDARKFAALRSAMARGWATALAPDPGPVHFDIPFRKPLEPVPVAPDDPAAVPAALAGELARAVHGGDDGAPWLRVDAAERVAAASTLNRLIDRIDASRRPLMLAGADSRGRQYRDALLRFAERAGVPILAESASGLRDAGGNTSVIAAGELVSAEWAGAAPDLILISGAAPLNWGVQRRIEQAADADLVVIGAAPEPANPWHRAAEHVVCDPSRLFDALTAVDYSGAPARAGWLELHREAGRIAAGLIDEHLGDHPGRRAQPSSPALWHTLGRALPGHAAVVSSSSMVVRDFDCFLTGRDRPLDVYFNRGLNGIDGVIATACGVAAARRQRGIMAPTVLVIGDVALRHDLGALPLARELGLDLTVVVVDNGGGEIFDQLPGADLGDVYRRHFVTPGALPLADLVPRGIPLIDTPGPDDLGTALAEAFRHPGLTLIRHATTPATNRRVRDAIRRALHNALRRLGRPPLAGA